MGWGVREYTWLVQSIKKSSTYQDVCDTKKKKLRFDFFYFIFLYVSPNSSSEVLVFMAMRAVIGRFKIAMTSLSE